MINICYCIFWRESSDYEYIYKKTFLFFNVHRFFLTVFPPTFNGFCSSTCTMLHSMSKKSPFMVIFNCILKAFKLIGFSRFFHVCEAAKRIKKTKRMKTKADVKNSQHHINSFYSYFVCKRTNKRNSLNESHSVKILYRILLEKSQKRYESLYNKLKITIRKYFLNTFRTLLLEL